MQPVLFEPDTLRVEPFKVQLLKWIGNKQRQAHKIIEYFPVNYGTYFEPFLGSGGVLATLAPKRGVGSDVYGPLIEIFQQLHTDSDVLKYWYAERYALVDQVGKVQAYEQILTSFNARPNGADFVFLTRTCYGGVVRFRKADGHMSTPCGAHNPINPESFGNRVDIWAERLRGSTFVHRDYREAFAQAKAGDLIYCDPPYVHSQTILYGAQSFNLPDLFEAVRDAKGRGVRVAVSLDGRKKSSDKALHIDIPEDLFEQTAFVEVGISMLDRFQSSGMLMDNADVHDRLLLTYSTGRVV